MRKHLEMTRESRFEVVNGRKSTKTWSKIRKFEDVGRLFKKMSEGEGEVKRNWGEMEGFSRIVTCIYILNGRSGSYFSNFESTAEIK